MRRRTPASTTPAHAFARYAVGFGILAGTNILATSTLHAQYTFTDVNPNRSTLDATDPDGASGGRVNGLASAPGNNAVFYAATEWGGLYRSTDGGNNWAHLPGHVPTATWDVEVDPGNAQRVFASSLFDGKVVSQAGINVSTDGGNTWTHPAATPPAAMCGAVQRQEPSAFGISIDAANAQRVYIGTNCGLAMSVDSGVTWSFVDPLQGAGGSTGNTWDVVAHGGGIVDICGDDGHARSTDSGVTWTATTQLPSGRCSIAASPDETNVIFATVTNNVFESDDGGANWTNLGTPDSRRQGRIPFVAVNDRTGNAFDLWYGDVSLFRGACTSNPGGAGLRCPQAAQNPASPPPAGWNGPFTRTPWTNWPNPLPVTQHAHDDVGDLVFDSQAGNDACPLVFASDGGVYRNNLTTSPGCQTPQWEQPTTTPHALWVYGMGGGDRAGNAVEDLYLGNQDNGSFATGNAGAAAPNWTNPDCCDVFDIAADATRVVYTLCCGFSLLVGQPQMVGVNNVGGNPAGAMPAFNFPDFIHLFGANQYVAVTTAGAFTTNNITAANVNWTQLGAASTPAGGFCAIQSGTTGGVTTFFAQTFCGTNNSSVWEVAGSSQLWRYVGTAANGTWVRVDNNSGLTGGFGIFAVDPTNPNRLYASHLAAAGPQMVSSSDGGSTWQLEPDLDALMTGNGAFRYQSQNGPTPGPSFQVGYAQPSLLAFDPDDNTIIVAGGRNSGVFLSTDGGEDWDLITDPVDPATSGVPHLPRPRFAYFDHEPSNRVNIYIGTQGRGVWRVSFFRPPIADADGPYVTLVGQDVMLIGAAVDPDGTPMGSLTFEWDFDGDGVFNDAVGPTPVFGGPFVSTPGTFPVTLRVTDPDGATDFATTSVAVIRGLRYALSLHAGVATDLSGFPPNTSAGLTLNVDGIIPFSQQVALDLRLGYSWLPVPAPAADTDIWNLSANIKFVPWLSSPMVLLNGGLGLYWLDYADLELGYNLGGGLSVPISSSIDLEATVNFHSILSTTPNMDFGKAQLGLIFNF